MYSSGQLIVLVLFPPCLAALIWLGFRSILAGYVDNRPRFKRCGFWVLLALMYICMTATFLIENKQ